MLINDGEASPTSEELHGRKRWNPTEEEKKNQSRQNWTTFSPQIRSLLPTCKLNLPIIRIKSANIWPL